MTLRAALKDSSMKSKKEEPKKGNKIEQPTRPNFNYFWVTPLISPKT